MKILFKIILTAALAYLLQYFFPWWTAVIAAFIVVLIVKSSWINDFLSGFLGVGLLWGIMALMIDMQTNSILTSKVAALFSLDNATYLILITGLVGGIAGGLGALCGNQVKESFTKEKAVKRY